MVFAHAQYVERTFPKSEKCTSDKNRDPYPGGVGGGEAFPVIH